jgi:AcrR family transcriptional regulator
MGRRGDHSYDELSKMIIEAAYSLMEKEGYSNVSTRKIAAQIGYTVGTLYNVYRNLDDIFIHINGKTIDKLHSILNKALDNAKPKDAVKSLANAYIQFSKENFNIWSMLFEYRFPPEQVMPKWYTEKINSLYLLVGKAISQIAPRMEENEQKNTIMVLWAGIHGICALSIKGKLDRAGSESAMVLVDNFIDNYLKGLGLVH